MQFGYDQYKRVNAAMICWRGSSGLLICTGIAFTLLVVKDVTEVQGC